MRGISTSLDDLKNEKFIFLSFIGIAQFALLKLFRFTINKRKIPGLL
jgi:hypothetical protein